jgi:hypothetical protein
VFREGWGAGKTDPPGGRILVNRKKIVSGKRKATGKNSYRKRRIYRF